LNEKNKYMMDKIIGFTISKKIIDHSDIDVFKTGIRSIELNLNGYHFYLWGINNFENCTINSQYSLAFPASDNLLDRNVLIEIKNSEIIIQNDWLGSIPVFYNEKELIVSTLSLKTLTDHEIHPEGLANFVESGFSILGQTPFQNVKFMRYYSKLILTPDGMQSVLKEDPVLGENVFTYISDEKIVSKRIETFIRNFEKCTSGEIIIPTSGGFDSRLLNLYVKDKSRIRAFSYGISDNQSESFEVIHAKKVAEILNISWEQIKLGDYNDLMGKWFELFGISTHLHGMYQIEFYQKIFARHRFDKTATLLSGIVGDAWSGNVSIKPISTEEELSSLSYSHGLHADVTALTISHGSELRKNFFRTYHGYLENEKIRIVFLIRFKLILLSYLLIVPEYFGIPTWTPFLNFDIVLGMLNLPEERRKGRQWQQDIFKKNKIDLETITKNKDMSNTLNRQAFTRFKFHPLNVPLLQKYFDTHYLISIEAVAQTQKKLNINY